MYRCRMINSFLKRQIDIVKLNVQHDLNPSSVTKPLCYRDLHKNLRLRFYLTSEKVKMYDKDRVNHVFGHKVGRNVLDVSILRFLRAATKKFCSTSTLPIVRFV